MSPSSTPNISTTKLSASPVPPTTSLLSYTGFAKPTSLLLFFGTTGIFALFSLFNLISSLPEDHRLKPNPPGPLYWFHDGTLAIMMRLHLWSALPAGILLPLQFLPIVRRKAPTLHRIAGRLLFIMLIIGNFTAVYMGSYSFGGTIETRIWIVFVAFLSSFSMRKSYCAIRRRDIAQHRAWALRTWSFACTILSLRIFMILIAISVHRFAPETYTGITTCKQLIFMYRSVKNETSVASLYDRYPTCRLDYSGRMKIMVDVSLDRSFPEERMAMMNMVFGVSGWAALTVHSLMMEVYLK